MQALVAVRLATPSRHRIGAFAREMAALPGVLNVFFLGGANDFQIHIAVETPDALREFVVRNLSARREVAFTETNVIFEHLVAGVEPESRGSPWAYVPRPMCARLAMISVIRWTLRALAAANVLCWVVRPGV